MEANKLGLGKPSDYNKYSKQFRIACGLEKINANHKYVFTIADTKKMNAASVKIPSISYVIDPYWRHDGTEIVLTKDNEKNKELMQESSPKQIPIACIESVKGDTITLRTIEFEQSERMVKRYEGRDLSKRKELEYLKVYPGNKTAIFSSLVACSKDIQEENAGARAKEDLEKSYEEEMVIKYIRNADSFSKIASWYQQLNMPLLSDKNMDENKAFLIRWIKKDENNLRVFQALEPETQKSLIDLVKKCEDLEIVTLNPSTMAWELYKSGYTICQVEKGEDKYDAISKFLREAPDGQAIKSYLNDLIIMDETETRIEGTKEVLIKNKPAEVEEQNIPVTTDESIKKEKPKMNWMLK